MRSDNPTSKDGARFRSIVKIHRPRGEGEVLMTMSESFPTVEMADDYGMKLARDSTRSNRYLALTGDERGRGVSITFGG